MPSDKKRMERLIKYHLNHHTGVEVQDVYKLLYQGFFGAEHLLTNKNKALYYLKQEWSTIKILDDEALYEPVSLDEKMVRINLRRAKAEGISFNQIWIAFFNSTGIVQKNQIEYKNIWDIFANLCREQILPFEEKSVKKFGMDMQKKGFPVVHHTEGYKRLNDPAYRVVQFDKIERKKDEKE